MSPRGSAGEVPSPASRFALSAPTSWIRAAVCCAVLPGACVLLTSPARAIDTNFQIANQLQGYYDSHLRESLIDNRLDALVTHGPYSLGASFLSHSPSEFSRLDPNKYGPPIEGIRKRWVEASTDKLGVRVGDAYATFGRGLALQVYEDQVVQFDNTLDGVYGHAETGPAAFQFIGGTNAYGVRNSLVLKGAHFDLGLPAGFRTGASGVWTDYNGTVGSGRSGGDRLYGGQFEGNLLDRVDFYSEYVLRDQKDGSGAASGMPQGHAGYLNVNLNLGPLQVLSEYKDLLRYNLPTFTREDGTPLPFVSPPTAVPQHATTLLNRATHVPNIRLYDEYGGLVETYLNLDSRTRLTASASGSKARHATLSSDFTPAGVFPDSRFPAWETYGEVERSLRENTDLVLRLDEAEETVNESGKPVFFERITGSGSLVLPLSGPWSMNATYEVQNAQESNQARIPEEYSYVSYRDNLVSLTLSRAPGMAWAVTAEWTNDPREARNTWVWGEWNLSLSDRYQLTLGGGRLRGGQVCSGGVCKIVDPFEGGRVELLTTF